MKETLELGSMGILNVENNKCGERLFATKITSFGGECTCETRISILIRTFYILGVSALRAETTAKGISAAREVSISAVQFLH